MFDFEMDVLKAFEAIRTDTLSSLVELVTMLGEESILIALFAVLYCAYDKRLVVKVFFVSVVSLSFNGIVKNIAQVPRPFASGEIVPVRAETATGYSFPSGHTQTFATWSMAFAAHFKKALWAIVALLFIVLVAISRMYLGVHFPSDVLVGALLGIFFGVVGSLVYDKVGNKSVLHYGALIAMTPFALYFFVEADPLFADFFKCYGMLVGLPLALMLEERFARIEYNVPWWKKALRVVLVATLTFAVKEGFAVFEVFDEARLILLFDALRYVFVVMAAFGIGPILVRKLNL